MIEQIISQVLAWVIIFYFIGIAILWIKSIFEPSERQILKDIRDELRKKNAREEENEEK